MTAYEFVNGKYVEQGSPEHILSLTVTENAKEYPTVSTEKVIVRHFKLLEKVLPNAVILAGLRR